MIDQNAQDINTLNFNVSIEECFAELKPHPKFKNCSFDNYIHDEKYPSQLYLKNLLKNISAAYLETSKNRWFSFFKNGGESPKNLYIDGAYGVGKTHLLSACFNNFPGKKAFLSFLELTYFMNYAGLEKTIEQFQNLDLLLIDEFDLDDPAAVRMAARFIEALNGKTLMVTTSNRLPKELGGGKFDSGQFARELGAISDAFKAITVEGKSFRINLAIWKAVFSENSFNGAFKNYKTARGKTLTEYSRLAKILEDNHPFKFFVLPKNFDAIFIDGFRPFRELNEALRFSIFIDHCYYHDTKLFFRTDEKGDIFPRDMLETSFERQFLRCESRLDELGIFFNK